MTTKRKKAKPVTGDAAVDNPDKPTRARAPRKRANAEPTALKFNAELKAKFLVHLENLHGIAISAEATGIGHSTVYEHLESDPDFAARVKATREKIIDQAEREVYARAVEGWDEPVFGRVARDEDGQIGTIRKKSDAMLALLLKGRRSDVYRDRQTVDMTATVRGAVMVVPPRPATEEAWAAQAQTTTLPKESK